MNGKKHNEFILVRYASFFNGFTVHSDIEDISVKSCKNLFWKLDFSTNYRYSKREKCN